MNLRSADEITLSHNCYFLDLRYEHLGICRCRIPLFTEAVYHRVHWRRP